MRIVGRVIQLVCGLVVLGIGLTSDGFGAAIAGGAVISAWAVYDIYRELNPDRRGVRDLDRELQALTRTQKDEHGDVR